jgi:hypothetical protein
MGRILNITSLVFLLLFPSCEEIEVNYCTEMDRSEGPLPFKTFAELSNDSIDCVLNVTEEASYIDPIFYVIRDQAAFDTLVQCNCYDFEFNFKDYSLLIGYFYYSAFGSAEFAKQEVTLNCSIVDQFLMYHVTVDVFDYDQSKSTLIQYNAIVPKLPEGLRIGNEVVRVKLYQQ